MKDVDLLSPDGIPFTAGTPAELNDLLNQGYRRVEDHQPAAGAGEAAPQQPEQPQAVAPAAAPDPTPAPPAPDTVPVHIPGPPPPPYQ